jgi:hypothetical protein
MHTARFRHPTVQEAQRRFGAFIRSPKSMSSKRLARAWLGVGLCFAAALARADSATVNANALGVAEGIINYCQSVDATAAEAARRATRSLVEGASEEQLKEARSSNEYRQGFESVGEFTAKIDPHNAKSYCNVSAAGGK